MHKLIFFSNVSAAIVFIALFYRAMIGWLVLLRFTRITKEIGLELDNISTRFRERISKMDMVASTAQIIGVEGQCRHGAELSVVRMVTQVVHQFLAARPDLAESRFCRWLNRVHFDSERQTSFGQLATQYGLFFTILGGLLSFSMIGNSSDDPFAAFSALALAMATTLAGLLISISIRHFTDRYRANRKAVVAMAEELFDDIRLYCCLRLEAEPNQNSGGSIVGQENRGSNPTVGSKKASSQVPNDASARWRTSHSQYSAVDEDLMESEYGIEAFRAIQSLESIDSGPLSNKQKTEGVSHVNAV